MVGEAASRRLEPRRAYVRDGDDHGAGDEVDREDTARGARSHILAQPEQPAARGHEVARVLEEVEADQVAVEHAAEQLVAH